MKRIYGISSLLFTSLSIMNLTSCTNAQQPSEEKYSLYYSYKGNMKGIECYCWEDDDSWYSCLMYGTNRLKAVDEISMLQETLPCPISDMKEILLSYSEYERTYCCVYIVSKPPKEEELKHEENDEDKETYEYLYQQLGLTYKVY